MTVLCEKLAQIIIIRTPHLYEIYHDKSWKQIASFIYVYMYNSVEILGH